MVAASVARRQRVQGQQRHRRRVAVVIVSCCCSGEPRRGDILDFWEGEVGVKQVLEGDNSASKGGVVSRESQVDKLGE